MKKYESPVLELRFLTESDVLTASTYQEIIYYDDGNLDEGFYDEVYW